MFKRPTFAQYLLFGGAALGALGLILWWRLPIAEKYPPFALTAALAMAYGAFEFWRDRTGRKP